MKAVILAGGEGTRLRPLTCNTPKPMVPILNRPFLEHMLSHLKGHGVDHAILTVCYLPDRIESHFGSAYGPGMDLSYVLEEQPLGTAGAVKNVEDTLDGSFFVLNGDIFTDLDLTDMVRFHRERQAQVTLFLTPVKNPSAFGVVETDQDSRVTRFLEKPSPQETTSNWINGGIYLMEPEVLAHAPSGQPYMFERGLFPKLLGMGVPVYGYRATPYWMDLGTPTSYMRVHRDILWAKPPLEQWDIPLNGGLANSQVHATARVTGPVLLGEGCDIGPGAVIKGPAVLGAGCVVGQEAYIQGSILWERVKVERNAVLRGCIVGDDASVGQGSTVGQRCILGDGVTLGRDNHMSGGTVVWPDRLLEPGTISFQ